MSNHQPQGAGNGPPSAGMNVPHGQGQPPAANLSQQNLNQIVRMSLLSLSLVLGCDMPSEADQYQPRYLARVISQGICRWARYF